jgi:hypothetical protein
MGYMKLPRAILVDLDDTILVAFWAGAVAVATYHNRFRRPARADRGDGHCGGDGPLGPLRQPYAGNGETPKIGACPPSIRR